MKIYSKMFLLTITCALLDLISYSAHADAIYLGAWSHHIKPADTINNENHKLIAVEYKGYFVSHFKNSFNDTTYGVAKRYEFYRSTDFTAAVYLGVTYGYKGACEASNEALPDNKVVCPLILPEIVYTKHKTQIAFSIMGNAIAIGPRWEF